jgi:hypothetical protein
VKNPNLSRFNYQKTAVRLFALMKDGKRRTIAEAARALNLTDSPVYCAARKLREDGELHICSWNMSQINGRFISVWEFGAGDDAPKPPREQWRRPVVTDDEHARRIADELARPAFRDPLIAAFYGEYRREGVCTT